MAVPPPMPLSNVAANWHQSSGIIQLEEGSVDLEQKLIILRNEKQLPNLGEITQAASSLLKKIPAEIEFFCQFVKPMGDHMTFWYRQRDQPIQERSGFSVPEKIWNWANSDAGKILQFRLKHPDET